MADGRAVAEHGRESNMLDTTSKSLPGLQHWKKCQLEPEETDLTDLQLTHEDWNQ